LYFFLTAAAKNRIIQELRGYWAGNPQYPDLVGNIQGKYSFSQRPQYGIIVKTGNATRVQLSADNFVGTVQSFVTLAKIPGYAGISVEWVREDSLAIRANGGRFPTPAGVYYCEMTENDEFYIDPLLEVRGEPLTMVNPAEGVLQQVPYTDSLRLVELPGGTLVPSSAYSIGEDGVTVYFREPLPNGISVVAYYRYTGTTTGPWEAKPFTGYNKAIPGCVLAFGRRAKKGDRFAVVVSPTREDAYLEYGGRWDLSIDIDIIARDVSSQMEMADQTAMFLWATLRGNLVDQGLDITDVSMGGESEEVYDENGDDYFYNSTISMTLQADWFAFVPVLPRILTVAETLQVLPQGLTLAAYRDPFYGAKFSSYETVS
jgi:hypothetical protein